MNLSEGITNDTTAEFDWVVQTFSFDLETSNEFFFWMFEGSTSLQGNQSSPQLPSPYFNITDDSALSISSVTATSTSSRASVTETSLLSPTYSPTCDGDNSKDSGGLSVGAKAGIGVSVSIAGLVIIACIGLYVRHSRKQQSPALKLHDNIPSVPSDQSRPKVTPIEMSTINSSGLAELS